MEGEERNDGGLVALNGDWFEMGFGFVFGWNLKVLLPWANESDDSIFSLWRPCFQFKC